MNKLTTYAAALLLTSVAAGCGTPSDRYDEFIGRDVRSNEASTGRIDPDGCTLPAPEEVDGEWRLAVATPGVSGKRPAMTVLDIEAKWTDPEAMDELELMIVAQALDAKDWETRVGEPIAADTVHTGSDFEIVLERQVIPGEANPLLYGTPMESEVVLNGQICRENFVDGSERLTTMCGLAGGTVFSPLVVDLSGSTYGAVWVPPGESAPHPLLDCDGTLGERSK